MQSIEPDGARLCALLVLVAACAPGPRAATGPDVEPSVGKHGMVSSAHGESEVADTIEGFRASFGDLRAEGLLA